MGCSHLGLMQHWDRSLTETQQQEHSVRLKGCHPAVWSRAWKYALGHWTIIMKCAGFPVPICREYSVFWYQCEDAAPVVESSLSVREVRGSMPHVCINWTWYTFFRTSFLHWSPSFTAMAVRSHSNCSFVYNTLYMLLVYRSLTYVWPVRCPLMCGSPCSTLWSWPPDTE